MSKETLVKRGAIMTYYELAERLKPERIYVNFIVELKELNGKVPFGDDVEVQPIMSF